MIRERACSAREVLAAHLAEIDRRNPELNAVITLDRKRAEARALAADEALARGETWGPLHGLPMTVKDGYDTAGLRTTYGLPHCRNHTPDRDAEVVAQLKAAGAIIFGKTNMPLASFDWQCKHPNFGRARNPWDPTRTTGGSSGGSAAALAARFTPLEMGGDVAGSLRVPAHFCGVAALRPTEGWVSDFGAHQAPGNPRLTLHLIAFGPMARDAADLELAMSVVAGPRPERPELPHWRPDPIDGLAGLRIAHWDAPCGSPLCPDTRRAFTHFLDKLENAGCRLTETEPFDMHEAYENWSRIQGFMIGAYLPAIMRLAPPLVYPLAAAALRPFTGPDPFPLRLTRNIGRSRRAFFQALEVRNRLIAEMDAFFERFDAFVTPVAATPAFTHRRTGARIRVGDVNVPYGVAMGPFNCPLATAANPIAVIPIDRSAEGLPIGVQIGGPRWRDPRLLAIAAHMETLAQHS